MQRVHIGCAGGLLEIWGPQSDTANDPDFQIHPEENKLVRFRGDATHQVLKHFSKTGQVWHASRRCARNLVVYTIYSVSDLQRQLGVFDYAMQARISSVIEQYIVPDELYNHTVEFEVFGQRALSEDVALFWELGWLPHGQDSES